MRIIGSDEFGMDIAEIGVVKETKINNRKFEQNEITFASTNYFDL